MRATATLSRRCAFLAVVGVALSSPVFPQQLTGGFTLGVRGVDVDGADAKYRQDVNLDDGPQLADFSLSFTPDDPQAPVDRIELAATHLGGEPFETMRLEARKYGRFDLQLQRQRSEYFYEDTILPPELASITGSTGGDFHLFDFERVRDAGKLDLRLGPATKLDLDFERYSKLGDGTTTLDIQRDEFELDRSIDESLSSVGIGLQHAWDKVTLVLEERIGDYENATELVLPGYSAGQNEADPAQLQLFRFSQPYEYESRSHAVKFVARPTPNVRVGAGLRRIDVDLDLQAAEDSAGFGFLGDPFQTALTGQAAVVRDSELDHFDLAYRLTERVELVIGARSSRLDQTGRSELGDVDGQSLWRIDTSGFSAGVETALGADFALHVGWSGESRDVDVSTNGPAAATTTDRDGYYIVFEYDPSSPLAVTLSVEDNAIDDPYALASPSGTRRYRAALRYRWDNGIAVSASRRRYEVENSAVSWRADTEQSDFRLSWFREDLELSLGIADVSVDRAVDQLVTGGTRQDLFAIAYRADSDFVDAAVRWRAGQRVALGAQLRRFDNGGSFPVQRDDWTTFVEVDLAAGYVASVSFRDIDYASDGFDDYAAQLVEVGVGMRW